IVENIGGTVFKTRDEQLMMAARALEPDFDISSDRISILNKSMPNPIKWYHNILDMPVDGTLSTIHGDLHLGNILIGPSDSALLIDFALTRDGHTIFDWANLEMSIISETIVPQVPDSWDGARLLINHLVALNNPGRTLSGAPELREALQAIVALRGIASQCLAHKNRWTEYHISLSMCALRAMQWHTMTLASRRVMFLLSALSMFEIQNKPSREINENTPSPDPESTEFDQ
ncbi:MAG: phosphotransferase, partial [Anaerolineae bacterium]|nr:phosphotransferase [Anaerolineae bacterium]